MPRRVLVLLLLCLLALTSVVQAGPTLQWSAGAVTSVLTTELNSLANNGFSAASGIIDNRIGQAGAGAFVCRVEGNLTFAANPTAGGAMVGWFLKNVDATNYENTPTSSIGLSRAPDFVLPATTGQTGTRVMVDVRCPPERFKVAVQNLATGQTLAASGNTLKILWISIQSN